MVLETANCSQNGLDLHIISLMQKRRFSKNLFNEDNI